MSLFKTWPGWFFPESAWERVDCPSAAEPLIRADGRGGYAYLTPACQSTMDAAWALSRQAMFPPMSFIMTLSQTQGRGQFHRAWISGQDNLLVTVRVPDQMARSGPLLTLALAAVMAEGLAALKLEPQIKWPNDILIGQKKVGGILLEQRQDEIMAGIGINVGSAPGDSQEGSGMKIPPASLWQFGFSKTPPELWDFLYRRMQTDLFDYLARPDALIFGINRRLAFKDEPVILETPDGTRRPVLIRGVDANGALVWQDPSGIAAARSGQIIPQILT